MSTSLPSSALTPSSPLRSPFSTSSSPFSRLPTELIWIIIKFTVPEDCYQDYDCDKDWRKYSLRQKTLSSHCLVSKLFYEIAKTLLSAIVISEGGSHHRTRTRWSRLRAGGGAHHALIRNLMFQPPCVLPISFDFDWSRFTELRSLVIESKVAEIDLVNLAALPSKSIPLEK
ncbi:uncharacterized protein JCM6883_007536 [Sporobolomyces salmoneus]|uniref:uncharacterized protein n=1 Tax=Sporobolomyces salmoneus TaxID=183962 RepID=UPI0031733B81